MEADNYRTYNDLRWDLRELMRQRPQRDYVYDRGSWKFYLNVCRDTLRVPSPCKDLGPVEVRSPGYQTLSKNGESACYLLGARILQFL